MCVCVYTYIWKSALYIASDENHVYKCKTMLLELFLGAFFVVF